MTHWPLSLKNVHIFVLAIRWWCTLSLLMLMFMLLLLYIREPSQPLDTFQNLIWIVLWLKGLGKSCRSSSCSESALQMREKSSLLFFLFRVAFPFLVAACLSIIVMRVFSSIRKFHTLMVVMWIFFRTARKTIIVIRSKRTWDLEKVHSRVSLLGWRHFEFLLVKMSFHDRENLYNVSDLIHILKEHLTVTFSILRFCKQSCLIFGK